MLLCKITRFPAVQLSPSLFWDVRQSKSVVFVGEQVSAISCVTSQKTETLMCLRISVSNISELISTKIMHRELD